MLSSAGNSPAAEQTSVTGLRVAFERVWPVFAFAVLPTVVAVMFLAQAWRQGIFALDFHHAYWNAARDVSRGTFSYPESIDTAGVPYLYPPLTAILFTPFVLLPLTTADAAYTICCAASLVVGLRLLGVRDWRCYGTAFLWPPALQALQTGNLTLPLFLGLAILWACRDRPLPAGTVAGMLVSAKLVLWPMLLFLVLTRRYRASLYAGVFGVAMNIAAWRVADAGNVFDYVDMVQHFSELHHLHSDTIPALAHYAGVPSPLGAGLLWLAIGLLAVASWRSRDQDAGVFGLSVVMALVAAPVVWLHYVVLLLVPIALSRPTLSWPWFLPFAFVFVVAEQGNAVPGEALVCVVIIAITAASSWRPVRVSSDAV